MTVDDDKKTDSKKSGPKKESGDEDIDDLELDLDLDDDELSLDFSDIEDIDLDDDFDDVELKEETEKKEEKIENVKGVERENEEVEGAELGVDEKTEEQIDNNKIKLDNAEDEIEAEDDDLVKSSKHLLKKYKKIKVEKTDKLQIDGDTEKIEEDSEQSMDVDDKKIIEVDEKLKNEYLARLSLIEFKNEELGNLGLDVNLIKDLINDAKKQIEKNDLTSAKPLIDNSENLSSGIFTDHRMNLISTIISFIETFIFELTDLDLDFNKAKKHFNQAKELLKKKDLAIANESLNQAIQNVNMILNNTRKDKIEDAYKLFDFWFNEVTDFDVDHKKIKSILKDSKKAFDSDDMVVAEEFLEKLAYSSKAEINKLDMEIDKKEDYIQQLDGIYNFEDYSSLSDAISRAKNMLEESLDKGIIQDKLDDLIDIYNRIIESQTKDEKPEINGIMTQFSEAKDAFEKEDYSTMEKVLSKLTKKLGVPEPETKSSSDIKHESESKPDQKTDKEPKIDPKVLMKFNSDLSDAVHEIKALSKNGLDVGELNSNVDKVRKLIEAEDIDPIGSLLDELKNKIKQLKEEEKDARKAKEVEQKEAKDEENIRLKMESLESNIEAAQKDGIKTNVTEDLLNYAKQRLKIKKYLEVIEILEHAQDVLDNTIKEEREKKLKDESTNFIKLCHKKIESLPEKQPGLDILTELFEKIRDEVDNKNYTAALELKEKFSTMFEEVKATVIPESTEEGVIEESTQDSKDYYDELKKFELENGSGDENELLDADIDIEELDIDDDQESDDLDFDPDIEEIEQEYDNEIGDHSPTQDSEDASSLPLDGNQDIELEKIQVNDSTPEELPIENVEQPPPKLEDIDVNKNIESEPQIQQNGTEIKIELEEKFDGEISVEARIDQVSESGRDDQTNIESPSRNEELEGKPIEDELISDDISKLEEITDAPIDNTMEDTIGSIETNNIDDEKFNVPPQDDKVVIIEKPDTTELIKEAFGFKISRGTGIFPVNGKNVNGTVRARSGDEQKQDPQEIQQIRKEVLTKLDNKRSGRRMNRPLFPHEIREINRKNGQGIGMGKDIDQLDRMEGYPEKPNHIDEYVEEDRDISRPYKFDNNVNSRLPGQSVKPEPISNDKQYTDYGHQQYRNQRTVLEHPPGSDQGPQQIQPSMNMNGYQRRPPRNGLPPMPGAQNMHGIQGMKGMAGLENGETQEQYETRINSLKKGALKGLQEIQSIISDTYYFGATIDELERISEDARNAFDDRDYQDVLLYVDKCEELSRQLKLGYMERLIAEFKHAGENSEYMEYLFRETENAYNSEKYKLGDELARRFINVTKDLEFEEKMTNQTWMYCRYCGNNIQRDSTFCSHCGEKLYS
jgi:hypothetical protein